MTVTVTARFDGGPCAKAPGRRRSLLARLVLHQLDEQIHHGAELGVLRDLYQHSRTPDKTAKSTPAR
jgi:hypothetical protein